MKEPKLKVEYVKIDEVIPYKYNARSHGDDDTTAIMKSIQAFGFNDPIGVWKDVIVEGHGRLIAAKRLGMTEIPVIRLDHLTDEERRAYALAHNKTAELSDWDFDILESELMEISDIDMTEFGFLNADDFGSDDSYFSEQKLDKSKNGEKCTCPACGFEFEI